MKAKLSDQKEKISEGLAPLPMYTCVHVRNGKEGENDVKYIKKY